MEFGENILLFSKKINREPKNLESLKNEIEKYFSVHFKKEKSYSEMLFDVNFLLEKLNELEQKISSYENSEEVLNVYSRFIQEKREIIEKELKNKKVS